MKTCKALILFSLAIMAACGGMSSTPGDPSQLAEQAYAQLKDAPPGLDLRVSDGKAGPPAFDRAKVAAARKLDAAESISLLARARPLESDAPDQQAFARRDRSPAPPSTGATIAGSFPGASQLTPPAKTSRSGEDLQVLRWMPEGKVPLAPELSVTFSQPMVAVTSQGDASRVTPVRLTPTPKGAWRWIGTRTIVFDPAVRFPQATTYQVEVPADTKSANGGALKTATKFTFETPAPTLVSSYPNSGPQRLDAPMLLVFDQKIDARAALAKLKVTANGKNHAIQMLDAATLAATVTKDKQLAAMVEAVKKNEQDGRWLAFRATETFPTDAAISVEIPAGTPSAEGPNVTTAPQSFGFRTYPPLKIVKSECGYDRECPPGAPFVIHFNNPLDADKFEEESQVVVSPDIPGVHVIQSGERVIVQGLTKASSTYKVVVAGNIRDEFGQTLGDEETRSFRISDARPTFFGPSGMVVVDPSAKKPTLDFFSTNYPQLKVRLYKVDPNDYDAYGFFVNNQWNKDRRPPIPGVKVFEQLVKTTTGQNELVETSVDLSPAMNPAGFGHAIAIVEPYPWTEKYDPPRHISWVQSTRLGIDASVDADNLVAFATELDTGKPAPGVLLELHPLRLQARTDDKGLATIPLETGSVKNDRASFLVAKRGEDVAFVTEHSASYSPRGRWTKQTRPKQLAWYVIDDRRMYKPGEEVSLKGWLRTIDYGKNGDVGGIAGAVATVGFRVTDSRRNEISKGSMPVSTVGGFDTKFTLPKTPNLGHAYIHFSAAGPAAQYDKAAFTHTIQVEEFRRPEFEVTAQASQGPFLVGGSGDVTVKAKYFSGGPLPGAPVNWFVTAGLIQFTPPNREEFIFGSWLPWWDYRGDDFDGNDYKPPKTWNLTSTTDAIGEHTMHLDFLSMNPAMPMSVTANASVTDVNRQTWSASSALIVHPSSVYAGLKTKKPFVEKGAPFDIEVIGVDLDGKVVPGSKIEVRVVRLDWEFKKGKYTTKEVDPQTCAVAAAKDPSRCTFATKEGGRYQATATAVDDKGRPNQTKLSFWVTGADRPKSRAVTQERVEIIPDKKEYTGGATAELLIQAPFYPAEGVVSWRRSGIVRLERITLTGPTQVITVPITAAMTPNLTVQVDLVGMSARLDDKGDPDPKLPKRPAYAVGSINLPVPPKERALAVTVAPGAAKLGPGETAKISVTVKDASGRPVPDAETAVIVVDEAILSLTGYQFPDPIDTFKMPDNLTRYRIIAIATAGDKQYGKGESAVTARLPLMVRPSPPRFLNFGDTFMLPVVVQNQTDEPMVVKIAARATNATLTDGAGREVSVPANDRVEVRFPAAAEMPGTARFQIVGASGSSSDAAELALPVWTPATTEAFATYGVIDDGAARQPVALPGRVVTQFGGLEVTTASTNLQALTDAMLYLVRYPYGCAEQRASRVLAITALKDVLTAFKTKDLPSPAAMESSVRSDIERLSQLQNADGGFAFWERGRPSEPYLTVYVTSALVHARKKDFAVPAKMLASASAYLKSIESHYPSYYGPEIRRTISSYALYTRRQMGDVDVAKGREIIREAGGPGNIDTLNMEATAWLLGAFAGQTSAAEERAALLRHAMNKVAETAGAASFTVSYGDGAYLVLASERRVDAVMLESLIQEKKDLDLIPKIVTGLLAHRKAGRWLNTQENTFALLAMDRYFGAYEKATPDFVARVWLGADYAGDRAFKGRSTDYFAIPIAMKDVAAHDKNDLVIEGRQGPWA